jgi:hypothetical protein
MFSRPLNFRKLRPEVLYIVHVLAGHWHTICRDGQNLTVSYLKTTVVASCMISTILHRSDTVFCHERSTNRLRRKIIAPFTRWLHRQYSQSGVSSGSAPLLIGEFPPRPSIAQTPLLGQGLHIVEASRSHSDTPQSVGHLWTSDHPVAESSSWQHTTITTNNHVSSGTGTHNRSRRASADPRFRPRGHRDLSVQYITK